MKNTSVFFLIFLIGMQLLPAQTGTLTGQFTDLRGKPLSYATVLVLDGDRFVTGARTDKEGKYTMANIDSGRYQVRIMYHGTGKRIYVADKRMENIRVIPDMINFLMASVVLEKYQDNHCYGDYRIPLFSKDPEPSGYTFGMYPFRF